MNQNLDPFEPLECEISSLLYSPQQEYIVGIEVDGTEYGVIINNYDGAILSFVDKGCSDFSHINIIHQVLLNFKKQAGFTLEKIFIEAKYGDIFYCRLKWTKYYNDENKPDKSVFNVVSIGDALILQSLTHCEFYVLKNVLDQLEKLELEEGFMENYDF